MSKAIQSAAEYAAALARIDALMDAEDGSVEGIELDMLAELVIAWERETKH